ncbi:sensor histidine kinase [Pedobacter sp. Hv1]|uniref:tetratricopeptide repeat-containing sensor histidine kinase n=1 Tax=Pedobacter sp. Hv1 TaxID=1740090 RepID=UPI0006D8C5DC|nr:sensor histidine kinase [Pedobacter sp. Hv1]KQC02513.1 hypothetical protein AQF98_02750 [Pedobacter sp. Hv1]
MPMHQTILTVKKATVFILLCISSITMAMGQSKIDSLKEALNSQKDKKRLALLLELCWEYRYHHPDSARMYGYQALKIAKTQKNIHIEVEALHNLAVTYEAQGNYKQSLAYNTAALKLRQQIGDELKTANTLNNIGIAYDELGNFTLSLKHYNLAYHTYKKYRNLEGIALVGTNLGILFKAHRDYKNVIKYYREANGIYQKLKQAREVAFTEANLGSVYFYTKQYDSCLYYSLKAQKTFKQLNILQFLPVTYVNAGMAYGELGQTQKAIDFLTIAIDLNVKYNNRKELAFARIYFAKLMLKLKRFKEATANAQQAVEGAEAIGASNEVMEGKHILSKIYAQQGNFDKAYQLFASATKIKDSLFQKDKTETISAYQVRYETEKKEEKIKSLNQQSLIQQLKIKQSNLLLFISGIVMVTGLIIVYFILNRRKLKARAELQTEINKQQEQTTKAVLSAEENERIRIAADLHDGVGQLLSTALISFNGLVKTYQYIDEHEKEKTKNVLSLLNESYDEMRSISHQMMPNALIKAGLTTAVKDFLAKIDKDQLKVTLETIGLNTRLDAQVESVLYRVIQETVNNVIKHANANTLNLQFLKDEDGVSITIEDDGKGFDIALLLQNEGIGLKNMVSRIAFLKGTIDFDSAIGKGTLVAIHIPN